MRVERLAEDKVRIFISYEDLEERGIGREDMWQRHGRKVQELFWDMLERAYIEVGFEVAGPISVECYTMPTEGIIVIVTRIPVPSLPTRSDTDDEETNDEDSFLEEQTHFVVGYRDFEDIIGLSKAIIGRKNIGCSLHHYKERYFLAFEFDNVPDEEYDSLLAVLCEFGDLSTVTHAVLAEYGKTIIEEDALQVIAKHF